MVSLLFAEEKITVKGSIQRTPTLRARSFFIGKAVDDSWIFGIISLIQPRNHEISQVQGKYGKTLADYLLLCKTNYKTRHDTFLFPEPFDMLAAGWNRPGAKPPEYEYLPATNGTGGFEKTGELLHG